MPTTLVSDHEDRPAGPGLEKVAQCLFCGSGKTASVLPGVSDLFFKADEGTFIYVTCGDCGSLWLESRPIGERLLKAYSSYYTHDAPPDDSRGFVRSLVRALYLKSRLSQPSGVLERLVVGLVRAVLPGNPGLDHHYRFAPKAPASVLDYGCGSGDFLLRMVPFGHRLVGVEYDPDLLSALAGRGIQIEDVVTVDQQPWAEAFDHISLAHVIEHVPDPLALLDRLFGFLKPGGSLFVEVPNAEATGYEIFGRYWRGLEAPRHFALPTRAALLSALENAGFVIEHQHIDRSARGWVWAESLSVAPETEAGAHKAAMQAAPPETGSNAEFLTFIARKPARELNPSG